MTSSDFYSKFIDNKNDNENYNYISNKNDDDTDYTSSSSSSSSLANNNESLASSSLSSSPSSLPLLNKKRKTISNIQPMQNKKRQRRNNNAVRVRVRGVQFVPNSKLMTDVAFPRKNAINPQHQEKAKTKQIIQGGGDEDEHQSSSTAKKNTVLWYTAQEMQTFKYSFIRDVQRYEQQQKQRQCCCDYNNNAAADDSDAGLERYTTYNRVRRRQKRKGMVQICQAVQAFEQSTLLPTTTKVSLTELLGQLLQRYHQSQQSSQS